MILVNVKNLKEEKGSSEHYEIKSDLPEFDSGDECLSLAEQAHISLDITNTGMCLLVTGDIEAAVKTTCARCLTSFPHQVNAEFFETYYDEEKGLPSETGDEDEFIPYCGHEIDIEPEIIKSVLLAMPIRALCHPECKGLCPECGINLNKGTCSCTTEDFDPRMAKLKDLLK